MTKTEAAEKPARKKTATKRPAAKKPAGRKPAKKAAPKKKRDDEVTEESAPVVVEEAFADDGSDDAPEVHEDIEDAQIIAETPAEDIEVLEAASDDLPEQADLTDEERELKEIYGTDTAPATAHAEYQDRQTADEDRPMMPEINAREERKAQWQERRDRRRQRREQRDRDRHERREQNQQQRPHAPQGQQQQHAQPPRERPAGTQPPPIREQPSLSSGLNGHDALARVGTPLGDAAASVFAQLRNGQPLPVRQLAAMMRKRSLVEADPEQLAPQLKAELLGDERSYRTLGLRPRIVYRGRDLFAPGPVATSATADAEANFASALSKLAGATHRALALRVSKASAAGFERLIHAYLVAAGYREVLWVKRIGGISYASAIAPGIDRQVLISARSGDQPIDRRGIGELRVGVEAKNLVAGILFSARELSEEAERELERAGRSIAVMCGDHLVSALIAAGVGVVSSAAPLHYVDDQLLDELLAG
jgi:restriction endonuclease